MVASSEIQSAGPTGNIFLDAITFSDVFVPGITITYALQGDPGDGLYGGAAWGDNGGRVAFAQVVASWSAVANVSFVEAAVRVVGLTSRGCEAIDDHRVEARVHALDARDRRLDQLGGRQLAAPHPLRLLPGVELRERIAHAGTSTVAHAGTSTVAHAGSRTISRTLTNRSGTIWTEYPDGRLRALLPSSGVTLPRTAAPAGTIR